MRPWAPRKLDGDATLSLYHHAILEFFGVFLQHVGELPGAGWIINFGHYLRQFLPRENSLLRMHVEMIEVRRVPVLRGRINGFDTLDGDQHVILHAAPFLLHQIVWAVKVRAQSCCFVGELGHVQAAVPLLEGAVVLLVAHPDSVAIWKADQRTWGHGCLLILFILYFNYAGPTGEAEPRQVAGSPSAASVLPPMLSMLRSHRELLCSPLLALRSKEGNGTRHASWA